MYTTAKATIDLSAIAHNLAVARSLAPQSRVMAAIKADAYGHGLLEVASELYQADGFAVARMEEVLALREAGIEQPILLLGSLLTARDLQLCARHRVAIVIHDRSTAALLCDSALSAPLDIWLKLDSGMHRLGLDPAAFAQTHHLLRASRNVASITHISHFSSADEVDGAITAAQMACFDRSVDALQESPPAPASLANSAALLRYPHSHRDWVRPGIMLYGANPLAAELELPDTQRLRPAMSLQAQIVAIRDIGAGESVSYNHRWTSARPTRLATVGIGYADGYPRHAANGTPVLVNGLRAPLVGRVCMDLLCVDISDCGNVSIGDQVTLWGSGLAAEEVALHAETISYELFTSVSKRVSRHYIR